METIKPLLEREDADDKCYQITGDILQTIEFRKKVRNYIKKGLKYFLTAALYIMT